MKKKTDGTLTVVGSGIKSISHLSVESQTYIRNADFILYSLNEPIIEEWIKANNAHVESLNAFENIDPLRSHCYTKMSEHICSHVKQKKNVCVVMYGHPTYFSIPALEAVINLKKEGYHTKILPAISAEDCLFADLHIDPGLAGRQSYEATDFLVRERTIDVSNHVIFWQVGIIGALGCISNHNNTKGIQLLTTHLKKFYDDRQPIITYIASLYPHIQPTIELSSLEKLPSLNLSSLSTLYIPPRFSPKINKNILLELGLSNYY